MQTIDRVNRYKEELKNNKERRFNIWAFLFSSFYFWYLGMFGHFLVFALLPAILALPLNLVIEEMGWAFWVGFLISHIIAGLIADKNYTKYRKNFITYYEKADPLKEVEYFAISLKRLVICTLLSGGVYAIYWGFKNWDKYQKTTNDAVNPYFRAWFINFTAFGLFSRINYSTKTFKWHNWFGAAVLLIFLADRILTQLLIKDEIPADWTLATAITLLVFMFVYPFCLVPAQISINRHATEVLHKPLEKRFYPWEIVILLLGIALNYSNWFVGETTPEEILTEEQAHKMGASVGFIYRHTKGYADVCQKEGYVFKQYPADFNALYAEDIKALTLAMNEKGYSMEDVENALITPQIENEMQQSIYAELDQLRKIWILSAIAEEQNQPAENMVWKEEYNAKMTMRDACEIFDIGGIELLKGSEQKSFLKDNAL